MSTSVRCETVRCLWQEQAAAAQQLAAVEAQWAARLEDLRERHKVSR